MVRWGLELFIALRDRSVTYVYLSQLIMRTPAREKRALG